MAIGRVHPRQPTRNRYFVREIRDTYPNKLEDRSLPTSVSLTRASEMMLLNDDPRVGDTSTSSDRIDKRRPAEGVLLYLVSVALVAAATIVLCGVASISLLGTSKETLTGSRIDNSLLEDKSIGAGFFYSGSSAAPVPVQTKSPSSSEAHNLLSSTPVLQPSAMPLEEAAAEPAPKPPSDGKLSATAVEGTHRSTQGPSIDKTPPLELGGSQEVIAQALSIANEARAAQPASGATMPPLATSDEQPEQNFEIQRNDHANLDQGSAAVFTPEGRFREKPQVMENSELYGSTASPKSPRHATSHRPSAIAANHNITEKLNRAELSRLLNGSRAPLR